MFSIHLPCKVLREVLKTEGKALGFQHFLHVYMVPYLTFLNHSKRSVENKGFCQITSTECSS